MRGSIRSLSPTEGKFRVKGDRAQRSGRRVISVPDALQDNEDGYFPAPIDFRATIKRRSSRFNIFLLGRTAVIIDNAAS
jgi:hypothetical protein